MRSEYLANLSLVEMQETSSLRVGSTFSVPAPVREKRGSGSSWVKLVAVLAGFCALGVLLAWRI